MRYRTPIIQARNQLLTGQTLIEQCLTGRGYPTVHRVCLIAVSQVLGGEGSSKLEFINVILSEDIREVPGTSFAPVGGGSFCSVLLTCLLSHPDTK